MLDSLAGAYEIKLNANKELLSSSEGNKIQSRVLQKYIRKPIFTQ